MNNTTRLGQRESERSQFDVLFLAPSAFKLILIITSAVTLERSEPVYTRSYGSVGVESGWGVIFIYLVAGATLFYVVCSVIAVFACKVLATAHRNASCAIAELVLSAAFAMAWLLISGYAGSVSWRSGRDTSARFMWISTMGAINTLAFLLLGGFHAFRTVTDKLQKHRMGGNFRA